MKFKNNQTISVIVPCFNSGKTLTRTIESFSLQNITTLAGYLEDQDLIDAYSSTDQLALCCAFARSVRSE